MEFKLAATITTERNNNSNSTQDVVVFVDVGTGVYIGRFNRQKADFFPNVSLEFLLNALPEVNVETITKFEFGENELRPKKGCDGVRCYSCAIVRIKFGGVWKNLVIEYLDGKIESHKHNFGEREIYFSADEPFEGRVCGLGEAHETFAEHTIAVKMTD